MMMMMCGIVKIVKVMSVSGGGGGVVMTCLRYHNRNSRRKAYRIVSQSRTALGFVEAGVDLLLQRGKRRGTRGGEIREDGGIKRWKERVM